MVTLHTGVESLVLSLSTAYQIFSGEPLTWDEVTGDYSNNETISVVDIADYATAAIFNRAFPDNTAIDFSAGYVSVLCNFVGCIFFVVICC